jgi:hypothetical protein
VALQLTSLMPRPLVVQSLKADKGLALQDLVLGAYDFIGTLDLSPEARVYLLDQLASTEYVGRASFLPAFILLTDHPLRLSTAPRSGIASVSAVTRRSS